MDRSTTPVVADDGVIPDEDWFHSLETPIGSQERPSQCEDQPTPTQTRQQNHNHPITTQRRDTSCLRNTLHSPNSQHNRDINSIQRTTAISPRSTDTPGSSHVRSVASRSNNNPRSIRLSESPSCRQALDLESDISDGDAPWSQEHTESIAGIDNDNSAGSDVSDSSEDNTFHDQEVDHLVSDLHVHVRANDYNASRTVVEDHWSRLFEDYIDCFFDEDWECLDTVDDTQCHSPVIGQCDSQTTIERANGQRTGGLPDWNYASPFTPMSVSVDDVDRNLERNFVQETNRMLSNVMGDVMAQFAHHDSGADVVPTLTRLQSFDVFVTRSLLEKLRLAINRALAERRKQLVTIEELKGIIIFHVLCASYGQTAATITDINERDSFLQMDIDADRYHEVWSALSCTANRRQRVSHRSTEWSTRPTRGNHLIMEVEEEVASINRRLLHIAGATVFALDDDHHRLSSRDVSLLTSLSQINNPKKALGPVNNALCSALTAVILVSHHTRPKEKLLDIWSRIVQLLQGQPTSGALTPMTDAIFAADRNYNVKETISFVNETLGATGIGTHKRSLDFPFVFGEGPVRKRHKGMDISEKGCRAIYSARKKRSKGSGRQIEAAVYRESFSGRVAAVYHNNISKFAANKFTLVPRHNFRGEIDPKRVDELQVIYDICEGNRRAPNVIGRSVVHSSVSASATRGVSMSRMKVQMVLKRVVQCTYLQSEDPVWFLVRAFKFTSRTSDNFFRAICRSFPASLAGMSRLLRGVRLSQHVSPLPDTEEEIKEMLMVKFNSVCDVLNLQRNEEDAGERSPSAADRIRQLNEQQMMELRKEELIKLLEYVGPRPPASLRKAQLVQKMLETKAQIISGELELTESPALSEEEMRNEQSKRLVRALQVASLHSWVMKPLVATSGMKEGSINEIEVLRAIPGFFQKAKSAYAIRMPSSITSVFGSFARRTGFCYTVEFLRSVGLIRGVDNAMLGDSPDGICGIRDERGEVTCASVEVKTMTSPVTIQESKEICESTHELIVYKLLKYFNDNQRVTRELCRASGLTVNPALCSEKLEKGPIRRIRPDHRLADTLSFQPTTRRAPRILHRWMSHGTIIPWLHSLCARAGQVEKDNADGYLAREVMSTGLTLASLLNEFHPEHLLYSSAVERLVRRLRVIEKSLGMERAERGPYLVKMLGFMGIGHGPVVQPEELN